jgi:hypothetical protein
VNTSKAPWRGHQSGYKSGKRRGIVQISEVANALIDPVLAKRAGLNTMLLGSWDEIAGAQFADCTRPERITWPRRASEMTGEGGGHQPGVLTHRLRRRTRALPQPPAGRDHPAYQRLLRLPGDQPGAHRAEARDTADEPSAEAAPADG